jgi:type 1 glutamine amidotransferase
MSTTRRNALKAGTAALASAAVLTPKKSEAALRAKKPGETQILYLGGDQLHNGMGQRQSIHGVFAQTGWRMLFTTDARRVTPELIAETDLMMITRWGGAIEGWCPDPIQEGRMESDGYMSDELEDAIVDNVQNRGMGFMSLHCTAWTPERQKFNDMMGIEGIMHGPVQTVLFYNINQDHPVTKGTEEFHIENDENFGVTLTSPKAVKLFNSVGAKDKRHDIAGWANESGKGRIVGLVAGHNHEAWRNKAYQQLYWRGAHWALRRDIPEFKS